MIRGLSGPKPPVHCSPNSLKCLDATNRLDDWFVQIQPSLMLGIGDVANQETFLMVNYLPNFFRYDDHPEFDSNQHIVRVLGGYKTGNLTLRLSQDVAILNNIYAGKTPARYPLSTFIATKLACVRRSNSSAQLQGAILARDACCRSDQAAFNLEL